MDRLTRLLGTEQGLDEANIALKYFVEEERPPVVGGILITCSDESERECSEAFQKSFADALLPQIKYWRRAPFRIANLGGRYEWGGLRIAEQHFALPASMDTFKIIVVKINSHVAASPTGEPLRFGVMERYGIESVACGALSTLLSGQVPPSLHDLEDVFGAEGLDRLTLLKSVERVNPNHRLLFAALVNARLQARNVILDIQEYKPTTPTLYLVTAWVTLNRSGVDTELLCGIYSADCRGEESCIEYQGLGDDPSRYVICTRGSRLFVEDEQVGIRRPARDHRTLIAEAWQGRNRPTVDSDRSQAARDAFVESTPLHRNDERILEAIDAARTGKHHDHRYAPRILRTLLHGLMAVAPVPAAVLLFAEGLGSIYHLHRIHRLAREVDRHDDARLILSEICGQIDRLAPERAKEVIDLLLAQYRF